LCFAKRYDAAGHRQEEQQLIVRHDDSQPYAMWNMYTLHDTLYFGAKVQCILFSETWVERTLLKDHKHETLPFEIGKVNLY
jgi:hypothetical protein